MLNKRIDLFNAGRSEELFVGRPFDINYNRVSILTSDYWKNTVKGIPQGCFLLAFYLGEDSVAEALLLRALYPIKLPNDSSITSSMIEYYKDDVEVTGLAGSLKNNNLDSFTKHEFSFSGLECRILGAFYKTKDSHQVIFGADIENFYAANNYKVYKATDGVLSHIVNQRENNYQNNNQEFKIGEVRYSSTRRFQADMYQEVKNNSNVTVYTSPEDFLGKRTALFGMTRTGKSNTVKKIIEATVQISDNHLQNNQTEKEKFPVGQIIFDINGEYANSNMQDDGTAIHEMYEDRAIRYSVAKKPGFKELKINFYRQIAGGFAFIQNYFNIQNDKADYVQNFASINLEPPADYSKNSTVRRRYHAKKLAYFCCLYRAGFQMPNNFTLHIPNMESDKGLIKINSMTSNHFERYIKQLTKAWENHTYRNNPDWMDEEVKSILIFLTRTRRSRGLQSINGYKKLANNYLKNFHTSDNETYFADDINKDVRLGKIIIVDLSQGLEDVQKVFSETICKHIFDTSLKIFTKNKTNKIIQFYFEEAHNLFPRKDNKDLTDIYSRLAKEGAKLNIGLVYATQEVSSISSNILKNTQNWFIAHLNNEDELKELRKYYDFADFVDSLIRFSPENDKGFVRMKTYSNPFVVPVQIDRFTTDNEG